MNKEQGRKREHGLVQVISRQGNLGPKTKQMVRTRKRVIIRGKSEGAFKAGRQVGLEKD